jgi:hypothetical protein
MHPAFLYIPEVVLLESPRTGAIFSGRTIIMPLDALTFNILSFSSYTLLISFVQFKIFLEAPHYHSWQTATAQAGTNMSEQYSVGATSL